jgi:hypothetical protein
MLNAGFKIVSIRIVNFGSNAKWQAYSTCNFNGTINAFLRCNSTKEGQIAHFGDGREPVLGYRVSVMDGLNPI